MCFKFIAAASVRGAKLHHATECAVSPSPTSAIGRTGDVTGEEEFSAIKYKKC